MTSLWWSYKTALVISSMSKTAPSLGLLDALLWSGRSGDVTTMLQAAIEITWPWSLYYCLGLPALHIFEVSCLCGSFLFFSPSHTASHHYLGISACDGTCTITALGKLKRRIRASRRIVWEQWAYSVNNAW